MRKSITNRKGIQLNKRKECLDLDVNNIHFFLLVIFVFNIIFSQFDY
jgi:hypothetical protein